MQPFWNFLSISKSSAAVTMTMKRGAGGLGAPDVLEKLGRPGFPSGMKILLVDTAKERQEIADQMQKLGYQGMLHCLPASLTFVRDDLHDSKTMVKCASLK